MNIRTQIDKQVKAYRYIRFSAAAGEIATLFGITGWDEGESRWAANVCFSAWLEERGGSGSHEEDQALETVKAKLLEHYTSRFVDNLLKHLGDVWGYRDGTSIFVYKTAFDKHICAGLDPKYVLATLASKGFIKSQNGVTPNTGKAKSTYTFTKSM